MSSIVVTGASGNLGKHVVQLLLEHGHSVRAYSRQAQPNLPASVQNFQGDILTGSGLVEAITGADTIIHCVSFFHEGFATDIEGTRNLIAAARQTGSPHLVYISIVGIDAIPFSYFQAKLQAERLIEQSELPWSILRVTQFHDFVLNSLTSWQDDKTNTLAIPEGASFQPIDVSEVATALVKVAEQPAAGRVEDMGGPQVLTLEELADTYQRVHHKNYTVRTHNLPGEYFEAFRYTDKLTPDHAVGRITWEDFLRQRV